MSVDGGENRVTELSLPGEFKRTPHLGISGMNFEPDVVLFLNVRKYQAGEHEAALWLVSDDTSEEVRAILPTTRNAENCLDDLRLLGHGAVAEE